MQSQPANALERALKAFKTLIAAIHEAVVKHNASGGKLLEVSERAQRVEVFQHGLIFPSLTLQFDAASAQISYVRPSRAMNKPADEGTIVPGYNEVFLLVDASGTAHRIACRKLAVFLLAPAIQNREAD
jgi:hypothetical protein